MAGEISQPACNHRVFATPCPHARERLKHRPALASGSWLNDSRLTVHRLTRAAPAFAAAGRPIRRKRSPQHRVYAGKQPFPINTGNTLAILLGFERFPTFEAGFQLPLRVSQRRQHRLGFIMRPGKERRIVHLLLQVFDLRLKHFNTLR